MGISVDLMTMSLLELSEQPDKTNNLEKSGVLTNKYTKVGDDYHGHKS